MIEKQKEICPLPTRPAEGAPRTVLKPQSQTVQVPVLTVTDEPCDPEQGLEVLSLGFPLKMFSRKYVYH